VPIHHAVLALLAGGPTHGYDLKARFHESVGPQWGDLNIGHLYQILDRLERDGHVRKRAVTQPDRPDKIVYRITNNGREELASWLSAPFVRQGGYRDDFFLKLFAASRLGAERLATVLAVQREAYLGELASLGKLRQRHRGDALVELLIEAATLHTKANLRVVELAERAADSLVSAGGTALEAVSDDEDAGAQAL
jgi:DNA-binding PadR family transcriptional regulator